MKKNLIVFFAVFIAAIALFAVSVSAERMTQTPVTLCESDTYGGDLFTITSIEDVSCYLLSGENRYKKVINFTVKGYFGSDIYSNGDMDFAIYCYDSYGNYVDTEYFNISASDYDSYLYEYGRYTYITVPDVTASIEIAAAYPGLWSNTLFKLDYRNVWSSDGRVMAIPVLMTPVYETVGWHGDVNLWSLDGRDITVPYPDVSKYKAVGWYEYEDYEINNFRNEYRKNLAEKNYSAIMNDADNYSYALKGTQYEQELYTAKTYAMDAWRKQANAPIVVYSNYVSKYSGYSIVTLCIRNVSYNPVKAFRLRFMCYDVFGRLRVKESEYCITDTWLPSADYCEYNCKVYDNNIEYISDPIITQVVYSDNSSWYR